MYYVTVNVCFDFSLLGKYHNYTLENNVLQVRKIYTCIPHVVPQTEY